MAITISDKDGNNQFFETYEEFERAMVLKMRLDGKEVPQDLIDSFKIGDKVRVIGNGNHPLSSLIVHFYEIGDIGVVEGVERDGSVKVSVAARERDVQIISPENLELVKEGREETKFSVGDKVKVVKESTGHNVGTIGRVIQVSSDEYSKPVYEIEPISGSEWDISLFHREVELESAEKDEFLPIGTKVRIVVTEGANGVFQFGDETEIGLVDVCDTDYSYALKMGGEKYWWVSNNSFEVIREDSEDFKDGDVVMITEDIPTDYRDFREGDIVLVENGESSGKPMIVGGGLKLEYTTDVADRLKLVCSKEDRLDIAAP